ncbi:MAG: tetratricopeptide repeat protein [Acidobacteriota bacterium]|nr:tetratricopeptide repeat protein [Acidobacteriota bacterium]
MLAQLLRPLSLIYLACVGTLSAYQQPPGNPAEAVKQAIQLTREHRYADAEAALKGVPPPQTPAQKISFLRLKAAIASGLGHFTAAAEAMSAASALAPDDQGLRVAAGIARLQEQIENHINPAQTLKHLRGETLPPDQAVDIHLRLAEILSRANLFSEATVDFGAASVLAPDRADLLYDLALAHFRSGQFPGALENAERAKAIQDSAGLESLIGDIQEKLGNALEAVHSYQSAVTLAPSEERYRLALALELLLHQTFDAALAVLNQSAALFPNSVRVKILLGLTYYFVDRSADAIQALLEALRIDPQDETAARYLGEITLQDTSAPDPGASAQICKFADEHPRNKTAGAFCGGILLRLARDSEDDSRRPEIIHRLRHAALVGPKEPVARCQLGKAFEWAGQWRQARPEMEACVHLDPDSPDGHYHLSRIYRRLGLTALADQQTTLQESAARRQSEESVRRTESVTKFLVLLDH